jgi:hypothetical protein
MAEQMGFGSLKAVIGNPFDSLSKINNVKCPLLVIHGTHDEVVPYTQGVTLFYHHNGIKKFVGIAEGKHNDLEFADERLYWNSVRSFILEQYPK